MNEDCFHEVLSRLEIGDLVRVAQTCKDLKKAAESTFLRVHKNHLERIELPGFADNRGAGRIIFQQFGHLLKSLRVDGNHIKGKDVVRRIGNRCHEHLTDLILSCVSEDLVNVPDGCKQNIAHLFSNLKGLLIEHCELPGWDSIMENVDMKVEELELRIHHINELQPFTMNYPSLKSLLLSGDYSSEFIELNKHIQEVNVYVDTESSFLNLSSILHLENLTKLTVASFDAEIELMPIAEMPNLEHLFLNVMNSTYSISLFLHALQHHQKLSEFHLHNWRGEEILLDHKGSPFSGLKTLVTRRELTSVVPKMKNLVAVQIDLEVWQDADLQAIRGIMKSNPKLKRLCLNVNEGWWFEGDPELNKQRILKEIIYLRRSQTNLLVIVHCERGNAFEMETIKYPGVILMWPKMKKEYLYSMDDFPAITFERADKESDIVLSFRNCFETQCPFCAYIYQ